MQFIMSAFQSHIQETEKENNSVVEVLISIHEILVERQPKILCPSKLKASLKKSAENVFMLIVTNFVLK
jgi:hypothetical protein